MPFGTPLATYLLLPWCIQQSWFLPWCIQQSLFLQQGFCYGGSGFGVGNSNSCGGSISIIDLTVTLPSPMAGFQSMLLSSSSCYQVPH
jgi:hypothetical protein